MEKKDFREKKGSLFNAIFMIKAYRYTSSIYTVFCPSVCLPLYEIYVTFIFKTIGCVIGLKKKLLF